MPKYDVQMCYEKWQYYRIEIEADSREAAEAKAQELWDNGCGSDPRFRYEEGEDDGNGAIVTECTEVEDARNSD